MIGKDTIAYLLSEGRVILQAPVAFSACVLLVIVGIWAVFNFYYSGRIENYKSQVETKEGTIKSKESLISDYESKLDGATPEEARRRLNDLEKKLEKLEYRHLSEQQKYIITSHVRTLVSGIDIDQDARAHDAEGYAADLSAAFSDAGWQTGFGMRMYPVRQGKKGLVLSVIDQRNLNKTEQVVHDALLRAEVAFDVLENRAPSAPGVPSHEKEAQLIIVSRS